MPRKQPQDLTGRVFGKWTVIKLAEKRKTKHGTVMLWECRCECGAVHNVMAGNLRSGKSNSCSKCWRAGKGNPKYRHGHSSVDGGFTPTYRTWATMLRRCDNPNDTVYQHYGAKGVTVCQRWRNFKSFLEDMGERPSTMRSIERLNRSEATKHYSCGKCEQCLSNGWVFHCRWATRHEQSRNKSNNHMLTYNGKSQCMTDWAAELGISVQTLSNRLNTYGWSVERALSTPVKR